MGLATRNASRTSDQDAAAHTTSGGRSIRLGWFFVCVGALGIGYCLVSGSKVLYARQLANSFVAAYDGGASTGSAGSDKHGSFVSIASQESGVGAGSTPTVVGRVEVPTIGLVTPLMSGDDSMSLLEGAGHIPGTAVPGGLGTVGIAGHRDTHFRLLGKVTPGMEVRLISKSGVYRYLVTSSEIVAPEQVSVLATSDVPGLVLVTCYPFRFIGHAPKRFVVHANLVSAAPDRFVDLTAR